MGLRAGERGALVPGSIGEPTAQDLSVRMEVEKTPDYLKPVAMPAEDFEAVIKKVGTAFKNGAATLVSSAYGTPEVFVFSPGRAGFTDWENDALIVEALDQLLELAFEEASDELIEEWADNYAFDMDVEVLKDQAREKINLIRKYAPEIRSVWKAKSTSVLPVIGRPRYKLMRNVASAQLEVQLSLNAASSRPGTDAGFPVNDMVVQLLPSDVAMLHHLFQDMLEAITGSATGMRAGA